VIRGSYDVVLPRRVVPQPTPELVSGGDCGACVLGGLFGIQVADVYDQLCYKERKPISSQAMRYALHAADAQGFADRVITDPARWPRDAEGYVDEFGHLAGMDCLKWWTYLRLGFDAGYYGVTEVDMDKRGPYGGGTNHWIMLVGARYIYTPKEGGGSIDHHVLVSCSSSKTPDEEWVDVGDFLRMRGGYNLLLARPCG
jgi:hypothetical protein